MDVAIAAKPSPMAARDEGPAVAVSAMAELGGRRGLVSDGDDVDPHGLTNAIAMNATIPTATATSERGRERAMRTESGR